MKRTISLLIAAITTCAFLPRLGQAQGPVRSGIYLGSEWGVNFAAGPHITGSSNDRASVCDEFINPMYAMVTAISGYENYNCTGPDRGVTGDWTNSFDGAQGFLAGVALGFPFREKYPGQILSWLRPEFEYVYRNTAYDQRSDIPSASGESGDKLVEELVAAQDWIGSITGHNLFGNLYFDFVNNSRVTPYIGFGAGIGFTAMDYGGLWARNFDMNGIATGEGLPNATEIRQNLAGTASVAETELSDMPIGYQMLWGVDYALAESMSFGVKGRWVDFGSFKDGGFFWDPLRGHVPNLRLDGSEPVSGRIKASDIGMFGVSVNLKYYF